MLIFARAVLEETSVLGLLRFELGFVFLFQLGILRFSLQPRAMPELPPLCPSPKTC